jgi:amino acid transporter
MVRALVAAILTITVLYLMANWALWRGLGIGGLAASKTPAADVIALAFGDVAGIVTAIAIAMATITSINATIVVGARTTYAAASDWPALQRIARWDRSRGIPVRAILSQSAVAVLLVGFGTYTRTGFATMIDYTSPVFWLFLTASGFAVIVLRIKQPDAERPFKVPLYPVLPLAFCAAMTGVAVLALGAVLMGLMSRRVRS